MVGEASSLEDKDLIENGIKEVVWNWVEVDPYNVILANNIREIETEPMMELAMSINEIGQLQPCIGDIVEIEGEKFVRVIAGQHRYYAIKHLCDSGFPRKIIIRIADRELSNEEILSIQMSENLQNKMTPEQDAKIIHSFWQSSKEIYGKENITIAWLARRMGRSPKKVSDSIKYVEGLSPKVQEMVSGGVLPYSTALLLTKLDKKEDSTSGEDYYSEQVRTAVFLISKKYSTKQAETYLKRKANEKNLAGPLFGDEVWKEIKTNGHIIAIRDQSSREGRAAIGWFDRMFKTVSMLDDPAKVKFTKAIVNAVEETGLAREQFYAELEQLGVKFE